jgi:FMN phosphatase YigB (HAD superfamily)
MGAWGEFVGSCPSGPLRAILFDYGNTLVNLDFSTIASLTGLGLDAATLARHDGAVRRAVDGYLTASRRRCVRPDTLRFLLQTLVEAAGAHLSTSSFDALAVENRRRSLWRVPNPDAAGVVSNLTALGVRVAVISNGDGSVERDLRFLGLMDGIEFVIDSAVVGVSKPEPGIFQLGLCRLGLAAHEVAYVGDLPGIDVVGAARAGLRPILYDPHDAFDDLPDRLVDVAPVEAVPRLKTLADLPRLAALS